MFMHLPEWAGRTVDGKAQPAPGLIELFVKSGVEPLQSSSQWLEADAGNADPNRIGAV